jgi:hypothetical protein
MAEEAVHLMAAEKQRGRKEKAGVLVSPLRAQPLVT